MPSVIPPWIKAADPAEHMAVGMHIGVQLGAQQAQEQMHQQQLAAKQAEFQQQMEMEQAAQRFKEVQAAKSQQLAAQDQALAQQKYSLAASQIAQKHQAMQEYQSAVTGGMDPNDAMLKYGPMMAANTGAAAAIRAHERESRAPTIPKEVTLPSGLSGVLVGNRFQYSPKASTGALAKVPEGTEYVPGDEEGTPAHWKLPAKPKSEMTAYQNIMERDRTERQLEKLLEANSSLDLSTDAIQPQVGKTMSARSVNQWKAAKTKADELRKRLDSFDNPDAPAATQSGRVRVKSPDGQTGSISADQLDDALAHGYTKAK